MPDQGIVFEQKSKTPGKTRPVQKIKTQDFDWQEVKAGE